MCIGHWMIRSMGEHSVCLRVGLVVISIGNVDRNWKVFPTIDRQFPQLHKSFSTSEIWTNHEKKDSAGSKVNLINATLQCKCNLDASSRCHLCFESWVHCSRVQRFGPFFLKGEQECRRDVRSSWNRSKLNLILIGREKFSSTFCYLFSHWSN